MHKNKHYCTSKNIVAVIRGRDVDEFDQDEFVTNEEKTLCWTEHAHLPVTLLLR